MPPPKILLLAALVDILPTAVEERGAARAR